MVNTEFESIIHSRNPENKVYCYNNWPLELRRVKLYEVNPENGNWIDCGTGYLNIKRDQNDFYIVVYSDEHSFSESKYLETSDGVEDQLLESYANNEVKIVHTSIKLNQEYCHQKESIITWQDGNNPDLYRALSFQHSESCNSVWNIITSIVPHLCVDLLENDFLENQTNFLVLSKPNAVNIDKIIDELEMESNLLNSESVIIDILHRGFLDDLFNLMQEFESKGDVNGLHKIFQVIRRIIIFYGHYNEVFEILLSDEYYLRFFKACEYDETVENYKTRISHKNFLENVKFHNVVPLPEVQTIHLNYRLMYLRDVVMPRHLDEQTLQRIATLINNNFSSIINMIVNTGEIWKYLKENVCKNFLVAKFIHAVLTVLKQNPMMSIYERHQIFMNLKLNYILGEFSGYLREDCTGAKQMLEIISTKKYENSAEYNNFDFTNPSYGNIKPIDLAIEVFSMVCDINPGLLRHAIQESISQNTKDIMDKSLFGSEIDEKIFTEDQISEKQGIQNESIHSGNNYKCYPSLWLTLCDIFISSSSESTQIQICSIFKRILDPKTMDVPERDDSLSLFYDMGILDRLVDCLLTDIESNNDINTLYSARVLFCDILATCVQEHNYRIKYKILQNQLPYKLLHFATYPFHKIFSISVVKFLRTCLGTRDDFYHRLFAKHDIFKEIFLIINKLKVSKNRGEGCILESVILEMLDFICRNNIQVLLKYIMEKYGDIINLLNNKASVGSKCKVFARIIESFKILSQNQFSANKEKSRPNNTSSKRSAEISYLNKNTNLYKDQNCLIVEKEERENVKIHCLNELLMDSEKETKKKKIFENSGTGEKLDNHQNLGGSFGKDFFLEKDPNESLSRYEVHEFVDSNSHLRKKKIDVQIKLKESRNVKLNSSSN